MMTCKAHLWKLLERERKGLTSMRYKLFGNLPWQSRLELPHRRCSFCQFCIFDMHPLERLTIFTMLAVVGVQSLRT